MMKTTPLFRPVGITELRLIADSKWLSFPPRLDWQPIFYPVLNQQYAEQIASEWNTEDAFSGYCGIVTRFNVRTSYLDQFQIENVGAALHNEYWIPAQELETFNSNIIGNIEMVNVFFGKQFSMPDNTSIKKILSDFNNKPITIYHENNIN